MAAEGPAVVAAELVEVAESFGTELVGIADTVAERIGSAKGNR